MMTIKVKFLTLASTMALLSLGATSVNAASGAGASIPSTSQNAQNLNYNLSSPAGARDYAYDNERFKETIPRVQEDPDAGNRVLPREKPVSYFKRDASVGILPKR